MLNWQGGIDECMTLEDGERDEFLILELKRSWNTYQENTPKNPELGISEEIGIQKCKTVATLAKKLFEAFFKEMEKTSNSLSAIFNFAFIFTKCLFDAQNVLETNLREEELK